jgi:hypothetical protein
MKSRIKCAFQWNKSFMENNMKNLAEEIREGLQHLIELSYETGHLSAKMEVSPMYAYQNREHQKELIDTRNRTKIALLGLIEEYWRSA